MLQIGSVLKRSIEAADLMARVVSGGRSRWNLLLCYREILRSTNSQEEVVLRLKTPGRKFTVNMRKSDLFTLSEIFHLRQYALQSALPARPTIIDAGANIGLASIWFLARFPGATLHAFEPESSNYRLLRANLESEQNVQLTQAALGASKGPVTLYLTDHSATHSVVKREPFPRSELKQEAVEQIRLADYLEQKRMDEVDLLKLDVEGCELDLLVGLGDDIRKVSVICGEVHDQIVPHNEFFEYLDHHGFSLVRSKHFGGDPGRRVHHFEAARR